MPTAQDIKHSIKRGLEFIGEDPEREGLVETPDRIVRSFQELFSGYAADTDSVLKVFDDGKCDEMVISKDIDFFSFCEHHCLPFFGTVAVGYIPSGKVVGVSKLSRVVDIFARRLQIQERMTTQIADLIQEKLNPKGVIVVCKARHLCMVMRGVKKKNSEMVTSAITGVFKDHVVRDEFFQAIKC